MKDNNTNGDAVPSDNEIVDVEYIDYDEKTTDLLDILLDQDNREPIELMDGRGRKVAFEQVAVIPHDVDGEMQLFVILKPLDKMDGINEDEAIVFFVDEDDEGNAMLRAEKDEKTAIEIFGRYYKLLKMANGEGED